MMQSIFRFVARLLTIRAIHERAHAAALRSAVDEPALAAGWFVGAAPSTRCHSIVSGTPTKALQEKPCLTYVRQGGFFKSRSVGTFGSMKCLEQRCTHAAVMQIG